VTAGQQLIDAYIREVAAALPGSRRARHDVLTELKDGLLDAASNHQCNGRPASTAAQAAIAEFGDARQVAAAYRPELAVIHARRIAFSFLASVPLVGFWWVLAAASSDLGERPAPPWQWQGLTPGSQLAVHLAACASLIAVVTALVTVFATGRIIRWLPISPRVTTTTAAMASLAAGAADLGIVTLVISQILSAPSALDPGPVTFAAMASLARITFSRRAAQRCLTAGAALA